MPGPLRTVIYDPEFEADARDILPDAQLLDAALEFITFLLAAEPETGQRFMGTTWRIIVDLPTGHQAAIFYASTSSTSAA